MSNAATVSKQKSAKQQTDGAAAHPSHSQELLKANMLQRLNRIDATADDYLNKTTIIMVQEIMQWEFGEKIIHHPEFNDIVHDIAETLLAHEQMQQTIQAVLQQLKA